MSLDALLNPIREQLAGLGFELADLRRTGTLERPILQLRVDRPDSGPGHGVTAEDCATISRTLERFLESRALVGPRYVLEVSSPGIERPLRWPEHWRRYVGHRARVRAAGWSGRREVEIVAVPDDEHVVLRPPGGAEQVVPFAEIGEARLMADWDAFLKRGRKGAPPRRPGA
ncbi:MAG TPA: ribosome maturation factor RimP [Gemmatimonadales bacterium]|nr:ribosome maturation factor RimP [Gemmatimonadales bacterium]